MPSMDKFDDKKDAEDRSSEQQQPTDDLINRIREESEQEAAKPVEKGKEDQKVTDKGKYDEEFDRDPAEGVQEHIENAQQIIENTKENGDEETQENVDTVIGDFADPDIQEKMGADKDSATAQAQVFAMLQQGDAGGLKEVTSGGDAD